jgi:4'-phosphopantetheinyl transferase
MNRAVLDSAAISSCLWSVPPDALSLENDEVHVWRAPLDLEASQVESLYGLLTAEETARAGRYYFDRDRRRFIVGRGLLRIMLGRYLKAAPERIRLCITPHGKPELAGEDGNETVRFNLSHSDGLALYAFTRSRRIGVDLELISRHHGDERIPERFFSPREVGALRRLSADVQLEAFFNCWTRKEAYIKAIGDGLSMPLDQFDVSLAPGEPAALLSTKGDPREASRWSLRSLIPAPGYVGALAVEGHDWRLRGWEWPDGSES